MDPEKRNGMSLKEKRELVYEVARFPQGAAEILQCWSRRDLLELICTELGKERKYTNVPKAKMISHLLKLVSRRNSQLKDNNSNALLLGQNNKDVMQKKVNGEQPQHLTKSVNSDLSLCREAHAGSLICKNVACQATLNEGDAYCKRCSCCICHKYDENKDPSLWLVCSSDNPYSGFSCGLSCHLRCALKNKKSGILKNASNKLDGSFYCFCCGKINWLMRNLRKQLAVASEARRVDVLCERLSLSHTMFKGSERYGEVSNILSSAVKMLKKEVGGALDQVCGIIGRGLVSRLSCVADVHKLCSSALEIVDSTLENTSVPETNNNLEPRGPQPRIHFEEITSSSLVIVLKYQDNSKEDIDGCRVWHRSAKVLNYPAEPTCHILRPNTRNVFSGLSPSTEYFFKVLPFGSTRGFVEFEAKCSTRILDRGSSQCSTQNSESMCVREDVPQYQKKESNVQKQPGAIQYESPKGSTNSSENNESPERHYKRAKIAARLDGASDNDESQVPPTSEIVPFTSSNSSPSEAPNKPDWLSSTPDSACKNHVERQYEYCVKVIRWLEHGGHMDKDLRVKFLTWFSLKASAKDRRIVSAFVDVFISDPASLVAQLMDAFRDAICSNEKPAPSKVVRCYTLWH